MFDHENVRDETVKARIKGAIIGAAVGNALGKPVTGLTGQEVLAYLGRLGVTGMLTFKDIRISTGKRDNLLITPSSPLGETGVQTAFMQGVARSLERAKGFDLDDQARMMVEVMANVSRGIGVTTKEAINGLAYHFETNGRHERARSPHQPHQSVLRKMTRDGTHVYEPAPMPSATEGCGSSAVTRVLPLAIGDSPVGGIDQPFARHCLELTRLTHNDERALCSAAGFGAAISSAIHAPSKLPPALMLRCGFNRCRSIMHYLEVALPPSPGMPLTRAVFDKVWDGFKLSPSWMDAADTTAFAPSALIRSLSLVHEALATTDDESTKIKDAMLAAVNPGGAADTIGFMAGALLGAIYGYDRFTRALPLWTSQVQGIEDLSKTADFLFSTVKTKLHTAWYY